MPPPPFNQSKSDAFAARMTERLNDAAIILMSSIGHQVGLFDAMAQLPPSTSAQIADAAGLNERYVREWLGAMVAGRVIDYDAADQTYTLPPEHSAWLTRAAGMNNLAFQAQYIPMLASVEPGIVRVFREGGGLPYSEFPRFHQLMGQDSRAVHDSQLLDKTLPLVPGLTSRLTGGIAVLDVGCGSGYALNLMARTFPASHFTGYDFSTEGIAAGRAQAAEFRVSNVTFKVQDAATMNDVSRYDFITAFDAIHDQAQPARVLSHIAAALKPDGIFLMLDVAASSNVQENIDHVLGAYLYTISTMHCMTVSLADGGAGLGTMWGEQLATQMLHDAGFAHVQVKRLDGDTLNNFYLATK